jgi:hypothetical protein
MRTAGAPQDCLKRKLRRVVLNIIDAETWELLLTRGAGSIQLRNSPKIPHFAHNSTLMEPILSQFNPVHT